MITYELRVSIHLHGIDAPHTLRYRRTDPRAEADGIAHQLRTRAAHVDINGFLVPVDDIQTITVEGIEMNPQKIQQRGTETHRGVSISPPCTVATKDSGGYGSPADR